jgi:hypothetical protein
MKTRNNKREKRRQTTRNNHIQRGGEKEIKTEILKVILQEQDEHESFKPQILELYYGDMYNTKTEVIKNENSVKSLEHEISVNLRDLIEYLNSAEVTNKLNKEENAGKLLKRRNEAIEILKKQVSTNYVDYEIDNFFRLFFPKADASGNIPPKKDDKKKVYETKDELITYMYSYPIDSDTFKAKGKEANPENNPFGFDLNVRRSDSNAWSEMMGIEAFLLTLNASGSNTNYFSEYYKKPMYTNKVTTTRRIPNFAYSGEKM